MRRNYDGKRKSDLEIWMDSNSHEYERFVYGISFVSLYHTQIPKRLVDLIHILRVCPPEIAGMCISTSQLQRNIF
jgi:hypothetical protein